MTNSILRIVVGNEAVNQSETGRLGSKVQSLQSVSTQNAIRNETSSVSNQNQADVTTLSNDAVLLTEALEAVRGISSMRVDVVNAIKQKIQSGSYNPDLNQVAAAVAKALKGT